MLGDAMKVAQFCVDQYLRRIDFSEAVSPTFETLNTLCWKHATHVPLDTLDLFVGQKKTLDLDSIYDNIVIKNRGGWCYELNGLFSMLLDAIGFKVSLLEGSCFMSGNDQFSSQFDHLLLKVNYKLNSSRHLKRA